MQLSQKTKATLGKYLSKVLNYKGIRLVTKAAIGICNLTGIHKFEIYGKIPDKPATLGIRHKFSINGRSLDIYLIAAASPRKVRGFINPNQFQKPFFKPFLEEWGAIPAERKYLKTLESDLYKDDNFGFSIEGSSEELSHEGYRTAAFIAKYHNPLIPVRVEMKKGRWGGFIGGSTKLEAREEIYVPHEAKKEELVKITERLMKELE
jgi:1-acyl-sn-glycerol-3-phosphate acyltransferase